MFSGEERVRIATDLPPGAFDKRLRRALDRLGDAEADEDGEDGEWVIRPASSLASFLSVVKMTARVAPTDDGYKVTVRYNLTPSPACIVLAVVVFFAVLGLGALIFFFPAFEKSSVGTEVKRALRDLEDDVEDDGAPAVRRGRGSRAAD